MFQWILTIVLTLSLLKTFASAENSDRVAQAITVMQSLCLAKSDLIIEAKGEGGLLILKRGAKVEGTYRETEIQSLLSKLQSEVNLMSEADKIRDCMKPHINKILESTLQNTPKGK